MATAPRDAAPTDLMTLLVDNHKAGRPLLEDAKLFRGSVLPDQTLGTFSKDDMHGSLLLQVAAGYTHSWQDPGFIGSYPIDRETTKFYANFSLEKHLTGEEVKSYSVKEVEKQLAPLVKEVAEAKNSTERVRAEDKLETVIKRDFYESAVPTKTPEGAPNRPKDLYIYSGPPNMAIRQAIPLQMAKVTTQNESVAKNAVYKGMRNPSLQTMHTLGRTGGRTGDAMGTLMKIAQADQAVTLQEKHGSKPLNQFLDAVAKEPPSDKHMRMERFAKALVEGAQHPNPEFNGKALAVAEAVSKLDPKKADYQDLVKTSSEAVKKFEASTSASNDMGSPTPSASKAMAPTAAREPAMAR